MTPEAVKGLWEEIKAQEKADKARRRGSGGPGGAQRRAGRRAGRAPCPDPGA